MLDLVEGWTEPIDYDLFIDGASFNMAGFSIAIKFWLENGSSVTPTGTATILVAATSRVRYAPASNEILHANSPLQVRWKVTDTSGKIFYCPNGDAEVWNIH